MKTRVGSEVWTRRRVICPTAARMRSRSPAIPCVTRGDALLMNRKPSVSNLIHFSSAFGSSTSAERVQVKNTAARRTRDRRIRRWYSRGNASFLAPTIPGHIIGRYGEHRRDLHTSPYSGTDRAL